jgi:hypothetical protein
MDPTSNWLPVFLFYSSIVSLSFFGLYVISFLGFELVYPFSGCLLVTLNSSSSSAPTVQWCGSCRESALEESRHAPNLYDQSYSSSLYFGNFERKSFMDVRESQKVSKCCSYVYWYFLFHLLSFPSIFLGAV